MVVAVAASALIPMLQRRFSTASSNRNVESSADRIENSPSRLYVLEISGFHVAAVVFLFAVISLTVGLTVGRGSLGKRLRDAQKSIPAVDDTSPALLNRPGEMTSRTSPSPAANTFNTPAVNPPARRRKNRAQKVHPLNPSTHHRKIQLPTWGRSDHLQQ